MRMRVATAIVYFTYLIGIFFLYHAVVVLVHGPPESLIFTRRSIKSQEIDKNLMAIDEDFIKRPGAPIWIKKSTHVEPKLILVWNDFFGEQFSDKNLNGCPDYQCHIHSDRSKAHKSAAIVFHLYNFFTADLPKERFAWQRYVFFLQESPDNSPAARFSDVRENFFNWTMSYRSDSDMPCPYGYTIRRSKPLPRALSKDFIAKKSRLVAWMVSNCAAASQRQKYVAELQKFIPVDIFGACGNKSCSKSNFRDCEILLDRDYKFYLAFENSICKDYITEKFWQRSQLNLIPIVLKRSVMERMAPDESYIAADDFENPKALADYLLYLDKNDDAYLAHFEWRRYYQIIYLNGLEHDRLERPWGFCQLCKKLWENDGLHKSYKNVAQWWDTEAHCDRELVGKLIGSKKKAIT